MLDERRVILVEICEAETVERLQVRPEIWSFFKLLYPIEIRLLWRDNVGKEKRFAQVDLRLRLRHGLRHV